MYDGPFCVLSIVDNRTFKRLIYEVLSHGPTHDDITKLLRRFKWILRRRGLKLHGATTDGSPLYPTPLNEVFPGVPHQVCEFHILAELTKAILRAVARVRKELAAQMPKLPRGRVQKTARPRLRCKKRLKQKTSELFDHRHLFVKHRLAPGEQKILRRITKGLPHLRTLRDIMDEAYRLFDRRCRTETALGKLAVLRKRVRRFKKVGKTLSKLFSPNLERALTFLDDSLLPSTSNAVERGYRRHRKMQKSVYRVRTQEHIIHRIALDMERDARASARQQAMALLHRKRAG